VSSRVMPANEWERTLDAIVATRGRSLLQYAFVLTRNRAEAADLVQDALLATFSRFRVRGDIGDVEAYVKRSILNRYLNQCRRARRWQLVRPRLITREQPVPVEDGVAAADSLARALGVLSPIQRAAFCLRFFDDLTVEQIATALGCSSGGAARHLADARQRLARELSRQEDR
jgi:RNA polymerase sigma factor (sigma-70 family)